MNRHNNPQYQAVRALIKENFQPTLEQMKHLYNLFGFKQLPYQKKSKRTTGNVRYYDPALNFGTGVHYVLNPEKGEMRKRNFRYGGPVNPRPGHQRVLLTAPFVNNIPKQMLYVLSTMISERLTNGKYVPPIDVNALKNISNTSVTLSPSTFTPQTIQQKATATIANVKQEGKQITLQVIINLP